MAIIKSFKEKQPFSTLYGKDQNGREINIYEFNRVQCSGHSLFYPNVLLKTCEQLYLPILERTMSLNTGSIYEQLGMNWNVETRSDAGATVHSDPVFFFVYNTDNYFHFVYDTLPYLITYFHLKKTFITMKLLVQYSTPEKKSMYPFVKEFMELLHITADDMVFITPTTEYSRVFVSTSYTHDIDSNVPPRKEIFDFFKNITLRIGQPSQSLPKKIYISRRTWMHKDYSNTGTNYTTRRMLANEDKLVDYLTLHGFQEIFSEKLSTFEKIQLFSSATHIIGAIGGGISNVVFSPKDTKLVAIVSPTFLDVNSRFAFCLERVNVCYYKNTYHTEEGRIKKYMRAKHLKSGIVGEIEDIRYADVLMTCTDGSNTGWNSETRYAKMYISKEEIVLLDNGLNSEWGINNIEDTLTHFDEVSPCPSLQSRPPHPLKES